MAATHTAVAVDRATGESRGERTVKARQQGHAQPVELVRDAVVEFLLWHAAHRVVRLQSDVVRQQ